MPSSQDHSNSKRCASNNPSKELSSQQDPSRSDDNHDPAEADKCAKPFDAFASTDDNTERTQVETQICPDGAETKVDNEEVENIQEIIGQIKVMTMKVDDGGSPKEASAENEEADDLFTRYSNDNVRMWHLLDEAGENTNYEDNTGWQQLVGYEGYRSLMEGVDGDNNVSTARKTSLSTELHPDVFFNMLLGNDGDRQE